MGNTPAQHRAAVGLFALRLSSRGITRSKGVTRKPKGAAGAQAAFRRLATLPRWLCLLLVLLSGCTVGPGQDTGPSHTGIQAHGVATKMPSLGGIRDPDLMEDMWKQNEEMRSSSLYYIPTVSPTSNENSTNSNFDFLRLSLLMSNDVESNPGPNPPPSQQSFASTGLQLWAVLLCWYGRL